MTSKRRIAALDIVLHRLAEVSDPASLGCACTPESKEGVRLYVQTWITPIVQSLRAALAGTMDGLDRHTLASAARDAAGLPSRIRFLKERDRDVRRAKSKYLHGDVGGGT